jgi:hypothetical protein
VIGGVVNAHVAVKFIYVRVLRGTNSMHSQSFVARLIWAVICGTLWILSWIIAEGIPVFNDALGLAVRSAYLTYTQLAASTDFFFFPTRAPYLLVGFHSVCLGSFGSI